MTRRLAAFSLLLAIGLPAASAQDTPTDATLGAKPPEGAVVLFNGKDLSDWVTLDGKTPALWPVGDGLFSVGRGKGGIMTKAKLGDFRLHLEFNVPLMPQAQGQARGNSGVYLGGEYELQILDSYGLKSANNDCAAIYKQVAPRVNACKPPLQWQTYDVTFHKARVEGGKVTKKARVTVVQNGVNVIDDAEIDVCPAGVTGKAGEDGPLMLQDHGNDVQFRNIWAVPLK